MEPESTITPAAEPARRSRGLILGVALVALLLFGAAGYFYSVRDANKEVSSAPQAPQVAQDSRRAGEDVASRPAESAAQPSSPQQPASPAPSAVAEAPPAVVEAPPAASAPTSGIPSPQPSRQSPAVQTQGPAESAPTESAARPAPPAALRDQPTSLPGEEIVFVQKPRVNIRSEPRVAGRVVGSASKGQQFKAVRRVGNWVQVEGDAGTGWISGRLLGSEKP